MRTKSPEQAEKILTAAAGLFATHRFHEARMEDLAAAAEIGKGTVYRYFQDKEALYLALLERASDGLVCHLNKAVRSDMGPRAKLEAIVGALMTYFDDRPHLFDLIQHAEAMKRHGARFPWQQARNHSRQLMLDAFEEGRCAGAFIIADPEMAVLMLQGSLRSLYCFGEKPRPADLSRRVVEMFLRSAAPAATSARAASSPRR